MTRALYWIAAELTVANVVACLALLHWVGVA